MYGKKFSVASALFILSLASAALAQTSGGGTSTVFPPLGCQNGGTMYWDGVPGDSVACVGINAGAKYQISCVQSGNPSTGSPELQCIAVSSATGQTYEGTFCSNSFGCIGQVMGWALSTAPPLPLP